MLTAVHSWKGSTSIPLRYFTSSLPHHDAAATSGPGLLITEASWSHSDTPHLVGLLRTSDRTDAETSTWQHTSLTEDKHPCPRWDLNLQFQQASDCRPTPQTARPLGLYCPKHTAFLNALTSLCRTNIMRLARQPDVCTSSIVLAWTTVGHFSIKQTIFWASLVDAYKQKFFS